ncbi:MAG: hypothetical protein WCI05_07515 [Myxococcales bacterium]
MYRAFGAAGGFSDEWLNRLYFFWVVDRSRLLRNLWDLCGVRLLMAVALLTFRCTPTLLAPCAHAGNAQLLGAAEQSSASELLANSRFERLGVDLRKLPLRVGVFGAEPWSEGLRGYIEAHSGIRAYDISVH